MPDLEHKKTRIILVIKNDPGSSLVTFLSYETYFPEALSLPSSSEALQVLILLKGKIVELLLLACPVCLPLLPERRHSFLQLFHPLFHLRILPL